MMKRVSIADPLWSALKQSADEAKRSVPDQLAFMIASWNAWGAQLYTAAKLEVKPGDIVVLQTDLHLTPEQLRELRKRADESFPDGVRTIIFSAGLKCLGLFRTEES